MGTARILQLRSCNQELGVRISGVTRAARNLGLTHQGLCYIINHRHQELLTARTPVRVRRRSIIGKGKPRRLETQFQFSEEEFEELQAFDRNAWRKEVGGHEELFIELHDRLPIGNDLRTRVIDLSAVALLVGMALCRNHSSWELFTGWEEWLAPADRMPTQSERRQATLAYLRVFLVESISL
jgi:hypothetical protein